jgi:hypothetical protein
MANMKLCRFIGLKTSSYFDEHYDWNDFCADLLRTNSQAQPE